MSEITKGKMERKGDLLRIGSNVIFAVARQGRTETEIAYAEENLRRWNAFEDGGIVEELKDVIQDMLNGLKYLRNTKTEPYGFGIDRLEKTGQAALAKS